MLYFTTFRSSQPHLLGLPVVEPNSCPTFWSYSPVLSNNSVGKGPPPTLVVYAFIIPIVVSTTYGGTPRPVHTPPIDVLDDVTNGKVPKSISNMHAFAPSAIILFF